MKEKICPIMAQGWISGYNVSAAQFFDLSTEPFINDNINRLPKCLKENCALWCTTIEFDENHKHKGYCGLRK